MGLGWKYTFWGTSPGDWFVNPELFPGIFIFNKKLDDSYDEIQEHCYKVIFYLALIITDKEDKLYSSDSTL